MIYNFKIKNKLLAISLFSTIIIMTASAVFWTSNSIKINNSNLENRIYIQGEIISRNIAAAILFADLDEAKVILEALITDKAINAVVLTSKHDIELLNIQFQDFDTAHHTSLAEKLFSHFHSANLKNKNFIIENNNVRLGSIDIHYHDNETHKLLFDYILSASLTTIIAVIIGSVLSSLMKPIVINPIIHLSNIAKRVRSTKDYSIRGKFYYPDETGFLTKDFNAMLEIIEQRENALEELVEIRTKQLKQQNNELETQINERQRSDVLRLESEQKFEQVFINAPIGMALLDKNGLIYRRNHAINIILARYHAEGNPSLKIQECINESAITDINHKINQLAAGNSGTFECEVEFFSKSKKPLLTILSFSAVYNPQNELLYIILQLQDVTTARKMAADLNHQANHDSLTGITNRRYLEQTLNDILSQDRSTTMTLCILDLDQFKVINDTCGHIAGDELLKNIASIISKKIRKNDTLSRIGGDEFALLLKDCDRIKASSITENLRQVIEEYKFFWDDHIFRVGASIGAACIHPTEPSNMTSIMQKADSACYTAKKLGRNRVHIIDDNEDITILNRHGEIQWVNKIHTALSENNFVLFVQLVSPLNSDPSDQRCEVLIRMKQKDSELLTPPSAFILTAERYGLTTKIDAWVVSALIETLKQSPHLLNNGPYWVNLSGVSFGDDRFIDKLESIIKHSGLPIGTVNFEITETSVIRNITEASKAMLRLTELGCQFALDDFGSGVSSFGYLKQLPVKFIKIDGLFVKNILVNKIDYIFVKSIIDIAKVMGIKTVAEYVESEEIKQTLITMGADYGQGFAIERPRPLVE
ncbi:MAG: diguanylate cyclase (GGDEF)-like protein [Cellvibrionaceae bacterium]|jgi:diguanylate cyclase (GGDEF)-like protein